MEYDTDELGEESEEEEEEEGEEAGAPSASRRKGRGRGGKEDEGEKEGKNEEEVVTIDLKARRRRGAHEKHNSRVTGFMPAGRVKRLEQRRAREAAARGEAPPPTSSSEQTAAAGAAGGQGSGRVESRYMQDLRNSPLGITGRWVPQVDDVDIDAPDAESVAIVTAPNKINTGSDGCWSFTLSSQGDGKRKLIYGGGSNSSGELGLGNDHPYVFVTVPRAAPLPKDIVAQSKKVGAAPVVTAGAAGLGFSVICLEDETIVAGTNIFGQLGIGRGTTAQGWRRRQDGQCRMVAGNLNSFSRVPRLSGVRMSIVACGYAHTVCSTADGRTFAWGLNYQGQLGLGHSSTNDTDVPRLLESLSGRRPVSIGCGRQHTLIAFEGGSLVSFGQNNCGQLGQGVVRRQAAAGDGSLPTDVTVGGGIGISQVACGSHHSLVVAQDGTVNDQASSIFSTLVLHLLCCAVYLRVVPGMERCEIPPFGM